jgi:amino acid adenylation domain-containing protein
LDGSQRLGVKLSYHNDRIASWAIDRMISSLKKIISQFERPQRVCDLDAVSKADRRLLEAWGCLDLAEQDFAQTALHQLFEQQVKRSPDACALKFEAFEMTYLEVDERANQLSHHLRGLVTIEANTLIGICMDRSADLIVSILAVLKAGAAYVPMDPMLPKGRVEYMLSDTNLVLLITQKRLHETHFADFGGPVVEIDTANVQTELQKCSTSSPSESGLVSSASDLAYVLYTSGSTGRPKGVMINHGSVVNLILSAVQRIGTNASSKWLQSTAIGFDIAILEIFGPLLQGGMLVLLPGASFATSVPLVIRMLESEEVNVIQATPSFWKLLLDSGWNLSSSSPKLTMLCGGEPLPGDLMRQLLPTEKRAIHHFYGPTETTIWSTYAKLTQSSQSVVIGTALGRTSLLVLDAQMRMVPIGCQGELYIGGNGVARGYLNRPDLTNQAFVSHTVQGRTLRMYRTGDMARWLPDGNLECIGRVDSQVKLRGFRIELGEIESVLRQQPVPADSTAIVLDAAVIAREDVPGEKKLVAYVVLQKTDQSLSPSSAIVELLRSRLSQKLPEYMIPSQFMFMDQMPLNSNGKLDRKALPIPENVVTTHVWSDIERQVADVFAAVLRVDRAHLSPSSNFFSLGGHSLVVPIICNKLNAIFHTSISFMDFLANTTIRLIGSLIRRRFVTSPENSFILPINQGTSSAQSPVFFFHPAAGLAFEYLPLRALATDRPIVALHNPRFGQPDFYASFDELVSHYCSIVTNYCPGPYTLAGWSSGGMLALEVARVLSQQANATVERVIMIDTPNFTGMDPILTTKEELLAVFKSDPDTRHLDNEVLEGLANHTFFTNSVLSNYRAKPYSGTVHLLRATLVKHTPQSEIEPNNKDDQHYNWHDFLPNLDVRPVEGYHEALFVEPYLESLLDQLCDILSIPSLGS